ncbi:hypothetical protein RUM43_014188, partial [Polyplax serrata]
VYGRGAGRRVVSWEECPLENKQRNSWNGFPRINTFFVFLAVKKGNKNEKER